MASAMKLGVQAGAFGLLQDEWKSIASASSPLEQISKLF
jgi:thiazole synthase ThiGH ThiG subunit